MILSRTPFRVSFFGGGSDLPGWYSQHGGCVLTSTIDKYTYLSARHMPPYLGHRYRVSWSHIETVNSREVIRHPSVRGCLQFLRMDEGYEIVHSGDLPARSGLGSSSAFTVGLLHALHGLRHEHVTKAGLAREAIEVEQFVLKETVGIQDQIECAYGGLNLIEIDPDGSYHVRPVSLRPDRLHELQSHLMLFFTGISRTSSGIQDAQVASIASGSVDLAPMAAMAHEGLKVLTGSGPIEAFGELLHDGWMLKRAASSAVSTPEIDDAYTRAMEAGAYGGKLLGAGGGGFLLIFARPQEQQAVRSALGMLECPVVFERAGTQIVHSS